MRSPMSVLTRDAILAEMNAGRLLITPFQPDQLGAASSLRPGALHSR